MINDELLPGKLYRIKTDFYSGNCLLCKGEIVVLLSIKRTSRRVIYNLLCGKQDYNLVLDADARRTFPHYYLERFE